MRRQFLTVAGPLDDDLEAGVGQAVQRAVPEYGVVEEAEPFLDAAVAGDHEAGDAMSADDQLVEVGGLLGGEAMEAQVVQDEQVRGEKGTEGAVDGVVDPGLGHGPEEVVGMAEADGVTGPDGGVAQGLSQESLAHTSGADQQDVLMPGEELQGEDGVQEPAVQGNGGSPVSDNAFELLPDAGISADPRVLKASRVPWSPDQPSIALSTAVFLLSVRSFPYRNRPAIVLVILPASLNNYFLDVPI